MNLSENFTLDELCASDAAVKLKIDNKPGEIETKNLARLAKEILQPARNELQKSIYVTSGYRCPKLNKAVGGAGSSQHVYGEAADIVVRNKNGQDTRAMKALFAILATKTKFGQLIWEYNGSWIHVSVPSSRLRTNGQILAIFTVGKRTSTIDITKTWKSYIGY